MRADRGMTLRVLAVALGVGLLAAPTAFARKAKKHVGPVVDPPAQLIGESLTSSVAWERLVYLCDAIGHRLSGTPQLERAVTWATEQMRQDGLKAWTEPVEVPVWVRGTESLTLLAPKVQELDLLALGGSVGTPAGGIEADVVVVGDKEEFEGLAEDAVRGKIVLWDVPFTSYGQTVQYRARGASLAAGKGAVASLVRSVTPSSLDTPHTGNQRYADGVEAIPAAAVTIETAAAMHRMQDRGMTPRVKLVLDGTGMNGTAMSANVLADVPGRETPEEIVVVGCHLDSWDVGQGAQDDAGGCVAAMEVGRLIRRLPQAPRRTVRVVLYTNEENGLGGGRAYAEAHADEVHVAAMESDTGQGASAGFRVDVRRMAENAGRYAEQDPALYETMMARLAGVKALLAPLEADGFRQAYAGADIGPLVATGVPGFGVDHDTTGYWPIHHTEADTIDKIDPTVFKRNIASMAVMTWWLAEHGL